ncbi:glycosyltransferase family 4 protein [uncultured Salinisphaera sp.]|uniref:glycosyltransferase family 4 protein n=1 Tax=uncultured Salinisphaera sp. TaxID=359372 RepID=UPI0032B189BB
MRIVHRINLDVPAGVEHQFRSLICHDRIQAAFDHDVVYGSGLHPALAPYILPCVGTATSFKRAGRLRLPRRPAFLRQQALARRLRRLQADVLLSWSGFARDAVSAAARNSATPLVYREGGGCWFEHSRDAAERFVGEIRGAICNTHASMRMLQLKWGFEGQARVCLGGIRPDVWAAVNASLSDPPVDRPTVPRIGVAARLASEKGVCLAIHALACLQADGVEASMDIAGNGPDRARLEALADTLGVRSRIVFLGHVSDMPAFYRSIDVLLHPALQEPLGNVTIEAQAFGVPVVATCVDGMAETIQSGETGTLVAAGQPYETYPRWGGTPSTMQSTQVYDPQGDCLKPAAFAHPRALADAVAEIVMDHPFQARLSTAASARAERLFSFERHVSDFIETIRLFVPGA